MIPSNPHAIVVINNNRFDSWTDKGLFESVSVQLVTNQCSEAKWCFFDPDFKLIDRFGASVLSGDLATVAVYLFYGKHPQGPPVFEGLLARIEREDAMTNFIAYDNGFKMKRVKKPGYHNSKNDLDILKVLATRNGLSFSPPPVPKKLEPHKAMTQDEQTDWEHALERARDAGLLLFVRGNTLFARYPAQIETPEAVFINRKDFETKHGFDFGFSVPEALESKKEVERRGRARGGKCLIGKSSINLRGKEMVALKRDTPGKHSVQKLSARAQAQKDLEREHAFEGSLSAIYPWSNPPLDVRDTVEILEIGALFSGKYICDAVSYEFNMSEFNLDLDLYRDVEGG